jgi:hypothetical protein
MLEYGRNYRCLTHYDHLHFYLKIVVVATELLRVDWRLFTNVSCWKWWGHHRKALPLLWTTWGRGKRRLLVNWCRSHWNHWRNSAVPVSRCTQSLALPAGARLQGFLAEDLPNSRTNFVFCSCDPPYSGRRTLNNVIFSGVLTDLFLRRSSASNANVLLSLRLRSVLEIFFCSP